MGQPTHPLVQRVGRVQLGQHGSLGLVSNKQYAEQTRVCNQVSHLATLLLLTLAQRDKAHPWLRLGQADLGLCRSS